MKNWMGTGSAALSFALWGMLPLYYQFMPEINMWETSAPFVRAWVRDELGPEAALADGIREQGKTLALIPDIIRRLDEQLPRKGAAPPAPPLPDIPLMWERRMERPRWPGYLLAAVLGGAAVAGTPPKNGTTRFAIP